MDHRRRPGSGRRAAPRTRQPPAVAPYREALRAGGIQLASFAVDDIAAEHERLLAAGVTFTQPPSEMGPVTTAILDDGFGNLVQLLQY